jgi:hypothetical protein
MKQGNGIVNATWFKSSLFVIALGMPLQVFAASDSGPCAAAPNRELDYWLGDWIVSAPGGTGTSTSRVSLSLDKCVIVENWGDGKDHTGENLFGYSYDDKSWHGFFADNRGRVHVFVDGTVASGVAEFQGSSVGDNGQKVLNRVRIVRVNPNQAEQLWEKSVDSGRTWTTAFRGEYTRRNP